MINRSIAGWVGLIHQGRRAAYPRVGFIACWLATLAISPLADAEIDGHGPDAWKVTGVKAGDVLNARMGPGTDYQVIDAFDPDEAGLEQITCVPFTAMGYYFKLSEAARDNLPPRWCLMRSSDLARAGWVAQQYISPDYPDAERSSEPAQVATSEELIESAQNLVRELYAAAERANEGGSHPLNPERTNQYFSADIVELLKTQPLQADPLVDAQDFQGSISDPVPDPVQPMFRGMITLNVGIENFGEQKTVVFRLRPDTSLPGAPVRIFRIEHEEWSFPELPSE